MDKKNVIIGISWLAFGVLFVEYKNLVHDFKLLATVLKENEEAIEMAKTICTDVTFQQITENLEED